MKAPVYISGPIGASKTSTMVSLMIDYLNEGRPVATNIDVFPERMYGLTDIGKSMPIIRIPDEPRSSDLKALGLAFDIKKFGHNTNLNGGLFYDEAGLSLNSRQWAHSDRADMEKVARMMRKLHWNLFIAVQDLDSIDKHIFNSTCRSIGWCTDSDAMLGASGNLFFTVLLFPLKLLFRFFCRFILKTPKLHFCSFYSGKSITNGLPQEKYTFTGRVYDGYDTDQLYSNGYESFDAPIRDSKGRIKVQVFDNDQPFLDKTGMPVFNFVPPDAAFSNPLFKVIREKIFIDMRANYSILPARYLEAWYPSGVPVRPLTVKETKAIEKDAKRLRLEYMKSIMQQPVKSSEDIHDVDKIKLGFTFGFWLSLPFRLVLMYALQREAKRINASWSDIAKVRGVLKNG